MHGVAPAVHHLPSRPRHARADQLHHPRTRRGVHRRHPHPLQALHGRHPLQVPSALLRLVRGRRRDPTLADGEDEAPIVPEEPVDVAHRCRARQAPEGVQGDRLRGSPRHGRDLSPGRHRHPPLGVGSFPDDAERSSRNRPPDSRRPTASSWGTLRVRGPDGATSAQGSAGGQFDLGVRLRNSCMSANAPFLLPICSRKKLRIKYAAGFFGSRRMASSKSLLAANGCRVAKRLFPRPRTQRRCWGRAGWPR